jgi:hypothetical protein
VRDRPSNRHRTASSHLVGGEAKRPDPVVARQNVDGNGLAPGVPDLVEGKVEDSQAVVMLAAAVQVEGERDRCRPIVTQPVIRKLEDRQVRVREDGLLE